MNYHIWTEGCQMNVADSLKIASYLERLGYHAVTRPEQADVIILNTCMVRQSAEDKAVGRLQSLKPLKKKNPDLVINLMGCMVGVKPHQRLRKRFPFVDVFSPPSDPEPLLSYLLEKEEREVSETSVQKQFAVLDGDLILPEAQKPMVSAYVPAVYGCSHSCTYCIIPSKRGAEISRPMDDILQEAESLVSQGVKEITVLGQIIDRYGLDIPGSGGLPGLLHKLHEIENLDRIRFLTSHPEWMTQELIETVAELPRVMPHIEVPAQAGNDQVLANMRRGYTGGQYHELITRIRKTIPGVSIGTDIIVGFPGETDEQFQETYDLLADLRMDVAHLARYSPRTGTISATRFPDDVPDEVKWDRFRKLEMLQKEISTEIHNSYMQKPVKVLVENIKKGRWWGRTETNKLVFIESEKDLQGKVVTGRIYWAGPWSMRAELID